MDGLNLQDEYKIQLEVFEGPLDLLLYLIKKEEVDIYNIPIEKIATQYMEYLNLMKMLDLNIAGEFLVMAATLMMIKSRMLLPEEERPELEDEEEDPRWELVKQLVEYKKFKDAASKLGDRELMQEDVFDLGAENMVFDREDDTEVVLGDLSLFDLISAFKDVLKSAKPEELGEIVAFKFTVTDKIDHILSMISKKSSVKFTELFSGDASKPEMICTFLGVLELIRLRQISINQSETFGEIIIVAAEEEEQEVHEELASDEAVEGESIWEKPDDESSDDEDDAETDEHPDDDDEDMEFDEDEDEDEFEEDDEDDLSEDSKKEC